MEKKIIFTASEPNSHALWLHRLQKNLVLQQFGPSGWETIGEGGGTGGGVTEEELADKLKLKADVTQLDFKADKTVLSTKADLVGGIVPVSQLPELPAPVDPTDYLKYTEYTTAGGTKTPAEFWANLIPLVNTAYPQQDIINLESSLLDTTLTDTVLIEKLSIATKVLLREANGKVYEFTADYPWSPGDFVNFVCIINETYLSSFSFNVKTNKLSSRSNKVFAADAITFDAYKKAGGTITDRNLFYTKLVALMST